MQIKEALQAIEDITNRYGLKPLYLDFTDTTLIARIGLSQNVFIQVYANEVKNKLNMALVVAEERIYGIDNEGGFYHEHPFQNPLLHIESYAISIEDFVVRSLEFLKKINLI